jgi:hypothetical protein
MAQIDDLPHKWKHYTEINESYVGSYVKAGKFTPEEAAKREAAELVRIPIGHQ